VATHTSLQLNVNQNMTDKKIILLSKEDCNIDNKIFSAICYKILSMVLKETMTFSKYFSRDQKIEYGINEHS